MTKPLLKVVNKAGVLKMFEHTSKVNEKSVERGLKLGGALVMRASMKQTPVDTGDLRRSHDASVEGSGFGTKVKVFVKQSYAIYVHEDPDAKHAPGTNYKFLARGLTESVPAIRTLILGKPAGGGGSKGSET